MAQARYLQITFQFEKPPEYTKLNPVFDNALDWARIADNVWIVWTTSTPTEWYERLKPVLRQNDFMYIFGIDNNVRHGWGRKWIWEWLDKKRT